MIGFRAHRQAARITQAELGRLVGVTKATISRWESGNRRVPAETAMLIDLATHGEIPKEVLRPDIFGPFPEATS